MYNQLNRALDPGLPEDWTPFKEGVLQLHVHWTNEAVRQYKKDITAGATYAEARSNLLSHSGVRADLLEAEFAWLKPELERRFPLQGSPHGL